MKRLHTGDHRTRISADSGSGHRSGLTLVELLIVLGVLVVIASLSWPRLMRFVDENTLRQNGELVRRELANTRILAIESGLTYQFRFEPNARDFVILPYDLPEVLKPKESGGRSTSLTDPQPAKVKTIVGHLSEGVQFTVPVSSPGPGNSSGGGRLEDQWLALLKDGALYTDTNWSAPILFRPNGSSQDAQLEIQDQVGKTIHLSVRGLTGSVRASKPKTEDSLQ